jgi:hypothetical protein
VVNTVDQNPFSGFTADYNNVYYRSSLGTINYLTGFIEPTANFTLSDGYKGQPLTIQSNKGSSLDIAGLFMDSQGTPGTLGTRLNMSAQNEVVSLMFNGTRWVLLYRSTGVTLFAV